MTKPKAKKTIKQKLAAGAKKIQKLRPGANPKPAKSTIGAELAKIDIQESKRPWKEIFDERVEILPGSIGLKIADDTPLEESLRILDWATTLSDHVGFFIGDVLNHGKTKYGDKYQRALNQTGRAYSTLKGYAEAAAKIPHSQRIAALTFSGHREVLRIPDKEKRVELLKELGSELKDGKLPTKMEIRERVNKLRPKKKVSPAIQPPRKELPVYEPTEEETGKLEVAEIGVREASKLLDVVVSVIKKLPSKDRRLWAGLLAPFANVCDELQESL